MCFSEVSGRVLVMFEEYEQIKPCMKGENRHGWTFTKFGYTPDV